jgi:hypothetical protein
VVLSRYQDWAVGLNNAGRKTEVAIQFCMAMPSDIMMSVHLDWVTNARASDDYAGGVDNLINVPHAGLLMWSLGMRPRCGLHLTCKYEQSALSLSVARARARCLSASVEAYVYMYCHN